MPEVRLASDWTFPFENGQPHCEYRPFPQLALHVDGATVAFNDVLDDR